jgi:hypothetical protein
MLLQLPDSGMWMDGIPNLIKSKKKGVLPERPLHQILLVILVLNGMQVFVPIKHGYRAGTPGGGAG